MRHIQTLATVAVLVGATITSLRAEDLSRGIRIAQVPDSNRPAEPIPPPEQIPRDCPTLEQLGYRTKPIGDLSLHVGLQDQQLPMDCSNSVFRETAPGRDERDWFATEFNWAASDLFAQPTYFDDPLLERYGQTRHPLVQPWLSGVHFFGQFPLMPYKIVVDRPFEEVYTLGYYRPGSPTPCLARRLPRP